MDQDHLPAFLLLRMVNPYHLGAHLQKLIQVVNLKHLQARNRELLRVKNRNHLHHQGRVVRKVAGDVDRIRDLSLGVQRREGALPDFHHKAGNWLSKTRVSDAVARAILDMRDYAERVAKKDL